MITAFHCLIVKFRKTFEILIFLIYQDMDIDSDMAETKAIVLPPDWKMCYSQSKKTHYFFNSKTRESTYKQPQWVFFYEF